MQGEEGPRGKGGKIGPPGLPVSRSNNVNLKCIPLNP